MSIVVQHTPPASTFFFPAAAYGWRQAQERDLDRRLKYGEFVATQRANQAKLAETIREFDIKAAADREESQAKRDQAAADRELKAAAQGEDVRQFDVTYERLTAEAARGRTFETGMQEDRQAAALNLQQQEAAIAKQIKETGEERAEVIKSINAEMGWKAIQGVQFDQGGEAIRRKTQADLDAIGTWEKGTDPEKRRERTARIEAAQKLLKDRDIKRPDPQKYVDEHTAYVTLGDGRKIAGTINHAGDFRPIPQQPDPVAVDKLKQKEKADVRTVEAEKWVRKQLDELPEVLSKEDPVWKTVDGRAVKTRTRPHYETLGYRSVEEAEKGERRRIYETSGLNPGGFAAAPQFREPSGPRPAPAPGMAPGQDYGGATGAAPSQVIPVEAAAAKAGVPVEIVLAAMKAARIDDPAFMAARVRKSQTVRETYDILKESGVELPWPRPPASPSTQGPDWIPQMPGDVMSSGMAPNAPSQAEPPPPPVAAPPPTDRDAKIARLRALAATGNAAAQKALAALEAENASR